MEQKTVKKYQVIGACTTTQTIYWDDVCKLMDGLVYNINFFQDFESFRIDGKTINSYKTSELVKFATNYKNEYEQKKAASFSDVYENYRMRQDLWKCAEKYEKQERKRLEKWKRDKPKRKKRIKKTMKKLMES